MASINVNNLPAKAAAAITTADQVMTFTASGDTTQTPFNEAVAQANTLNLINSVKTVKITIPTAQVLTLYTTPVAFGITVPAGYIPLLLSDPILSATYGGATYATNTNLSIRSIGGAENITDTAAAIAFTADTIRLLTLRDGASNTLLYVSGADLEAYIETGDPTVGNSDIYIYFTYTLIEL